LSTKVVVQQLFFATKLRYGHIHLPSLARSSGRRWPKAGGGCKIAQGLRPLAKHPEQDFSAGPNRTFPAQKRGKPTHICAPGAPGRRPLAGDFQSAECPTTRPYSLDFPCATHRERVPEEWTRAVIHRTYSKFEFILLNSSYSGYYRGLRGIPHASKNHFTGISKPQDHAA